MLPKVSNPRGYSRYVSRQMFASFFFLLTIRFQSLMGRVRATIFISPSESLSTFLIASFLVLICFALLFHRLQCN